MRVSIISFSFALSFNQNIELMPKIELTFYHCIEDTDTHSDALPGIFFDEAEINYEYGDFSKSDSSFPKQDSSVNAYYKTIEVDLDEILDIYEIDIEEYNTDSQHYNRNYIEATSYNDWTIIDEGHSFEVASISKSNAETDEMIDEVINKLNDHFGKTWRDGFKKYTSLYINESGEITFDEYDSEDKPNEIVNIRIADHTHNPQNGRNDLNVLICDDDATGGRFYTANTHLKYDSDSDLDEIVDDILNYFLT